MRTILLVALVAACTPSTAGAKTRTLKPVAHLATPRASHSATVLPDGTLLIAGGFRKGPDGRSQVYTATTEIFDPVSGEVRAGPSMVEARSGHIAAELPDGGVLLAGGWNERGLVRSAEIYDPARSAFVAVGDLTEARGAATATVLADGRVLIVGGADADDGVLASAELYDPDTGAFTSTGPLVTARYKHGAILRDDGSVLVVGGSSAEDWRGKYATTEIYDPETGTFAKGPKLGDARFKLPDGVVGDARGGIVIAGGARTIERIGRDGKRRTIARLGRATYNGTAVRLGREIVLVGGYGDDVQAGDEVWSIR